MKFQTVPDDFCKPSPINFEKNLQIQNSFSEPDIIDIEIINKPKISPPQLDNNISSRNPSTIMRFGHYLSEKILTIKGLRWKYFVQEVLVKNFCAFSFAVLLMEIQSYVKQYFYCDLDNSNIFVVLYVLTRSMTLDLFYYFLLSYYAIKTCWLDVPLRNYSIFFLLTLICLVLKVYKIDPIENFLDIYLVNFAWAFLQIFISYKKQVVSWQNLRSRVLPMMSLLCFCFLFNFYAMKKVIIPSFKQATNEIWNKTLGRAIFQMFLFIYFRIYYKIFFRILVIYSKLSTNNNKDSVILFAKYYLLDAVSSSAPSAISIPLDSFEAWLGFFNFLYQVLVLYDGNFDIFKNLKTLLSQILKIKTSNEESKDQEENQVTELLSLSLNQVLIIIYLHLLFWYCWRRCLADLVLKSDCGFLIYDYVEIRLSNILVLFLLNLTLVFGLILRKKDSLKLTWTLESYSSLFQIYYILLLHFILDNSLQYYFQFYYLIKLEII